MTEVIVLVGAGSIGQAIARRVSAGKSVLIADLRQENADAAAKTLSDAGFDVRTATVDVSSRGSVENLAASATAMGEVSGFIQAAGVSPSQAPIETILKVDLYGTALLLEEFGKVIARGGAGVVISSESGYRMGPLTVQQNRQFATTPVEELLELPFLQPGEVKDTLHAYQLSKRGNSLRVKAEAVRWGAPRRRGAASRAPRARRPVCRSRQSRIFLRVPHLDAPPVRTRLPDVAERPCRPVAPQRAAHARWGDRSVRPISR